MATSFLHQRIPNGIRKATTDYGQRHIVETAIVIAGVAGTEFKSLGSESVIKHADGRNVLNGLNWRCAAAVDAERLMLPHSLKASHLVLCLPKYLGEFEFRYNMRKCPEIMFDRLLLSF